MGTLELAVIGLVGSGVGVGVAGLETVISRAWLRFGEFSVGVGLHLWRFIP